jgi:phosphoribosylpyrophosphate synthetase
MQSGYQGFVAWATKRGEPLKKTAEEYVKTLKKYQEYQSDGLIDGLYKMKHTYSDVYLDQVFYLDFYSIERFGKTKLGQLLLYAKQSQNRDMMRELARIAREPIEKVISRYQVEAVGYIPPSVRREIQFMRELQRQLAVALPNLSIEKVAADIVVPQKTLGRLEDRIANAKATIIVRDKKQFDTVLLIDDALGSGATLNETAKKLKSQHVAKQVIGLAITGSFSGFEIISEV